MTKLCGRVRIGLPGGPANTRLRVQHISRRTDVGGTGAEDSYIPETPPEEEEVEP